MFYFTICDGLYRYFYYPETERVPFDAHCCHMGTAIKYPLPDRVKLCSERQCAQTKKLQMTGEHGLAQDDL